MSRMTREELIELNKKALTLVEGLVVRDPYISSPEGQFLKELAYAVSRLEDFLYPDLAGENPNEASKND